MTQTAPTRDLARNAIPVPARVSDVLGQVSVSTATAALANAAHSPSATGGWAYRSVAFHQLQSVAATPTDDETRWIQADLKFYGRVVTRLRRPGRLIPAEDVLADLDADER